MTATITVVGLGPGREENLSLGTYRLLTGGSRIWMRTEKHPVVQWLKREGVDFETFDAFYEKHTDFPAVYREITDTLLAEAERGGDLIYAVPGHPSVAEETVRRLLVDAGERGIDVQIQGGGSFLDPLFASLGVDPIEGFLLLDGTGLDSAQIDPRYHLVIAQVYDRMVASEVKLSLMEVFPDDYPVTVMTAAGVPGQERTESLPLYELDREERFTDLSSVYVSPAKEDRLLRRRFETLKAIIARLRAPDGCPWDRKQTHNTLRPYLLEESYEFLEAVAEGDPEAMADELGDVLLQVLLHSQIGKEQGEFDISDVIGHLSDKLIRRHPHVFGEEVIKNAAEVAQKWEEVKQRERKRDSREADSLLDGVPSEFPALLRSHKLQKKAAKAGFDWENPDGARRKLQEELGELFAASREEREGEMGDLLFSAVNLARLFDVDPEQALLAACRKFTRRFRGVEESARKAGGQVQDFPLEQLDRWWEEAKREEAEG
ncbi:nucleoside triphosphate pyrophosphohydrolase [Paludifilum halophilum]|uniref:Nucleoside triphosphate pyrophosphohydrolase n=1 Tax=Paludifilum halophilum TaxID=1642702 RepID=A0A235B292_9BACL|nr:nucleoside triphosphate pyrophosphohydrolase [Paludifilum halophilum]OYD06362.1 nucleoside triphosphate pyrophosphohydrolase [Paludifilum halophilum]